MFHSELFVFEKELQPTGKSCSCWKSKPNVALRAPAFRCSSRSVVTLRLGKLNYAQKWFYRNIFKKNEKWYWKTWFYRFKFFRLRRAQKMILPKHDFIGSRLYFESWRDEFLTPSQCWDSEISCFAHWCWSKPSVNYLENHHLSVMNSTNLFWSRKYENFQFHLKQKFLSNILSMKYSD